jgi:hypothetical protein
MQKFQGLRQGGSGNQLAGMPVRPFRRLDNLVDCLPQELFVFRIVLHKEELNGFRVGHMG